MQEKTSSFIKLYYNIYNIRKYKFENKKNILLFRDLTIV